MLFVGRLIDTKNLFFLLDALALVVSRYPKAILLFAGDGDQRVALERHTERNGLADHVIFAGRKQSKDLYTCYNVGQIFVLPSYYEHFGTVVNETLLAGYYTLCSSATGTVCLVNPLESGAIFDSHSKDGLMGQLTAALNMIPVLSELRLKENKMLNSYDIYFANFMNRLDDLLNK